MQHDLLAMGLGMRPEPDPPLAHLRLHRRDVGFKAFEVHDERRRLHVAGNDSSLVGNASDRWSGRR